MLPLARAGRRHHVEVVEIDRPHAVLQRLGHHRDAAGPRLEVLRQQRLGEAVVLDALLPGVRRARRRQVMIADPRHAAFPREEDQPLPEVVQARHALDLDLESDRIHGARSPEPAAASSSPISSC